MKEFTKSRFVAGGALSGVSKILALGLVFAATGCSTVFTSVTSGVTSPSYQSLTGNWQFQLIPTAGPVISPIVAGYLDQEPENATSNSLSAELQVVNPSSCYEGANLVPLYGYVRGDEVGIYSFTVNGQFLNTNFTENPTQTTLTGTYQVLGGCAGGQGAAGTMIGIRYAPLTGTFNGSLTGTATSLPVTLTLAQTPLGNGDGTFFVAGTASIQNSSCFNQGAIAATAGYVLGSAMNLTFTAADGSQLSLEGSFDPTADTITITAASFVNGSCPGSLGTGRLLLQQQISSIS